MSLLSLSHVPSCLPLWCRQLSGARLLSLVLLAAADLHGEPEQSPGTRYFVDVERYRFGTAPNTNDAGFYPIPRDAVTQETCFTALDAFDPASIAKNRFLATREIVTFEESFEARVAPLWNTQNIGPQLGEHWANTFVHQPVADNGTRSMKSPPVDLLVWFAPRDDCRLQVIDRLIEDPRAEACPNQVRYAWEGTPAAGEKLVFTQVYYPHPPYRSRAVSNNPNPNVSAAYASELQATAHASGIRVIRDDPEATILRLELQPGEVEWVVFNPAGATPQLDEVETDKPYQYRR